MRRRHPAIRLAATLLGVFYGGLAGLTLGFMAGVSMFEGMGAAQGFADSDFPGVVLIFLLSLGVTVGGLLGGLAVFRLSRPNNREQGPFRPVAKADLREMHPLSGPVLDED